MSYNWFKFIQQQIKISTKVKAACTLIALRAIYSLKIIFNIIKIVKAVSIEKMDKP